LKKTIPRKLRIKGKIAKLKDSLRYLFHFSDAEKISLRQRRLISPKTTIAPYCGRPGLVIISKALEDIALEEIILSNMEIPLNHKLPVNYGIICCCTISFLE
jgi:hypothetical protein